MERHKVLVFRPYPFEVRQKIYIESGPRKGDWEVVGIDERKVALRCPITAREFRWNRFCCLVEEREDEPWPHRD